jgi:hypothetical protein
MKAPEAPLTPFSDSFYRDCLENGWRGLDRVFLVAQRGNKEASTLVLPTRGTQSGAYSDFPNSF